MVSVAADLRLAKNFFKLQKLCPSLGEVRGKNKYSTCPARAECETGWRGAASFAVRLLDSATSMLKIAQ